MLKANEIHEPSYDDMFGSKLKQERSCGFSPIDKCRFLRPGEVTVLFSRAPLARSALAMNLAAKMSLKDENGNGVLVVSPRLSADMYLAEMAMTIADIGKWRLTHGFVMKNERAEETARYNDAIARLKGARLCFEDELCVEPDQILKAAQRANREHGLGLVIVDQLQDLGCGPLANGAVGWGVVGSRLHQLAALYRVPLLVLSGAANGGGREDLVRGYGCLNEYVDQVIDLVRYEAAAEDGRAVFVLRHDGSPDCEPGVKIQMSLRSLKILECQEWCKEINVEPPEIEEEPEE